MLSTVFKCGAVDEIKVAKNPLSIRNSQSNTYIKTKHLQSYSTSNRSYPFCDFDEGVLLTKFPVGFNSSNGNDHFSSIISGADKQVEATRKVMGVKDA